MLRQQASNFLREQLDLNGLQEWHVRLTTDLSRPFLGMCSYKDKCIILNAHHIDIHPDVEVKNTILHEIAHALMPMHGHDSFWMEKAKALGCDDLSPCSTLSLPPSAIDAIRSGADLEVSFETRTVRDVHYKVTKLQDKCPSCGKIAKEKSFKEVKTSGGYKKVIFLECGHLIVKDVDSQSAFEDITFDGVPTCKHVWNKTVCLKCNAKKLFPYQIAGARALERANGKLALLDEMGLGKTLQALAYLKFHPEAFPVLWVTKSGIKFQHAKEILRVLGDRYLPQVILTGKETPDARFKIYIASYDIFRRLSLDTFTEAKIQTIVLDECQAIKNPDSTRTQCIRRVAREIPHIIPMSGTFWKNRGSEAFVMLNMLDPARFYSFQNFKDRHVEYYYQGNKTKEGGFKRPKEFQKLISDITIRRERAEVMPELPLINRTRLLCEVPDYALNVYNQEQDKIAAIYNDAVIGGEEDSFATNAAIMQSLMIMRQIVGIAKVPTTVEFTQEFLEETDRKLVIFVAHIKCGDLIYSQLAEYCKENGLAEPLRIEGGMDAISRMEIADKFNSSSHRLLIASTLASGEGLNLQTCSDCIMHERQWNPANEEQAEGRFIRIGQTAQSVNATYVHGDGTIDIDLDSIVEGKRIKFHVSMNKGEMPSWNEKSIVQELAERIAKKRKRVA